MSELYELGPFVLDPQAGALTRSGAPSALGSRGVAVLAALLEHPREYVSKSRIMDAAWPDLVVEESNLAVQISAIRRVLAQAPGGEHWIETLPRRGYRFIGPVAKVAGDRWQGTRSSSGNTNLPEALTSFIGRERELVDIKGILAEKRLLTLVGAGGIGKTRLALRAAAEVIDAYRSGVWLVELGSISDPTLVPTSVAQVLGVHERSGIRLTQTLCNHLEARQSLLVLDNCEHLLDACARLVEALLSETRELKMIATSREPLQVAGEQTYPLPTLSLPDAAGCAETMRDSDAVRLFVERARSQQPDFALTAARAPAIAQLCIRLDGIPLALELAAARVRSLSIEQINERIDDRFRLLTGGSRSALPRQQTLRATLDWSYDLLTEHERVVLLRLAIFPGTFTLDAASSVACDAVIDELAVMDVMSRLVGRSLVVADASDACARYRLLETTRAYALEKLAETGKTTTIQQRHAQYYRRLFARAREDWLRLPETIWNRTYLLEHDNVRVALEWALGADGDSAIAIALAGASGPLWTTRSLQLEGARWLDAAVARLGPDTSDVEQARLWLSAGTLFLDSVPARALAPLERAIAVYRKLGDILGLGESLEKLAHALVRLGRFELGESALAEAHPLLACSGLPKALAFYYIDRAFLEMSTGDPAAARATYEQSLPLLRIAGAESHALSLFQNLADITWALGDLDAAAASFRETIAMMRKYPMTRESALGMALANLAGVLTELGMLDEALAAAREGMPKLSDCGRAWIFMDHMALLAALTGKLANAARIAGYADATIVAKEFVRQANEARAYTRLHALLREKLAADELGRLITEGSNFSEVEALRMALEG